MATKTTSKKASSSSKKTADKKKAAAAPQPLKIVRSDEWLAPYEPAIAGRHQHVLDKMAEITNGGKQKLSDFATGYLYYGLHLEDKKWILREWAPNATAIYLIGDFNNWKEDKAYAMKRLTKTAGDWELKLPAKAIKHGQLYKLSIHWEGG